MNLIEKIMLWKRTRDMVREMSFMEMPKMMRPIEGCPMVYEAPEIIRGWYYHSPEFMTVDKYDRGQNILDNEVGCVIMTQGLNILPILRVCIKRPATGSGKKGFTEGA